MRITLKQLAVFEAVARLGSIKAAAAEISLSQSATTMSLQDLERSLGVQLFYRVKKRLSLNENGRRLQPMAKSLLVQVKEIETVSLQAKTLHGQLKIAATPIIGQYLIPTTCRDFLARHPDVKISLETGNVTDVTTMVDSVACDIGLIESPVHRSSLIAKRLGSDVLTIFASPQHPLANQDHVAIEALHDQVWFVPNIGSIARITLMLALGDRFGSMNIRFESDSVEAIKRAVAGSSALGCLSSLAVRDEIDAGILAEIRVPDLSLARSFHLIHRKHVFHGEVQLAFIEYAMAAIPPILIQDDSLHRRSRSVRYQRSIQPSASPQAESN